MARAIGIVAIVLVLFPLSLSGTTAHLSGSDSVVGDKLAIVDYTKYDTERLHAIAQWNSLWDDGGDVWVYAWYSGQSIQLAMDDDTTSIACASGDNAYYKPSTDYIWFIVCNMDENTEAERKKTAAHEVGHALGLDHSFSGQVMYAYESSVNTIGSHDECDFKIMWAGWSYCTCHSPCFAGGGS